MGETFAMNTWQSSQNIEMTFWRIDIIKSSYINDCPTTIREIFVKLNLAY